MRVNRELDLFDGELVLARDGKLVDQFGGVRTDGHCEVNPRMMCVWVEAVAGSRRMRAGSEAIHVVQAAVDRRLEGRSSWLAAVREKVEAAT